LLFEQLNPGNHKTYLVADDDSREAMIIDPVVTRVDQYVSRIHQLGFRITMAVDTHTHADHVTGCPTLANQMKCEYVMHELANAKCVDRRVVNGDILYVDIFEGVFYLSKGEGPDLSIELTNEPPDLDELKARKEGRTQQTP